MADIDLGMLSSLNKKKPIANSFCLIYDDIDCEVAKQVTQFIIEQQFGDPESRPDVLNVLINSQGGSVTDAFAIIDVMASSHIPIRTIGLGQIASAALMIFLVGNERILTPNTSILSHRFSAGASGKQHDLFAIQKEYSLTSDRMVDHYVKYTKISKKKIIEFLLPPQDVYLSAKEALDLGLCHKVANLK